MVVSDIFLACFALCPVPHAFVVISIFTIAVRPGMWPKPVSFTRPDDGDAGVSGRQSADWTAGRHVSSLSLHHRAPVIGNKDPGSHVSPAVRIDLSSPSDTHELSQSALAYKHASLDRSEGCPNTIAM